jgi:Kdo2-lipid IVA lauroyltransferase/acyltransferase
MRNDFEFFIVWFLIRLFALLPRTLGRRLGATIGGFAFHVLPRLRRVGLRNLEIAFPSSSLQERERILHTLYRNLGWQLVEFGKMPSYTRQNTEHLMRYEGLERYLAAKAKGKGVLILTGHLGAWELSSFYHSLMGYPMSMVIRRLDNTAVDKLVNGIRCLHGNQVLHKDDFARALLLSMRKGESVGILMDTNMTPPQGVFVDFFGRPACTAAGLARVALKTGAAVLPGFMLWEPSEGKYVLHFGEEIPIAATDDDQTDILEVTQRLTSELESWIRRYPEQWLWVHRRWKTRPAGESSVY